MKVFDPHPYMKALYEKESKFKASFFGRKVGLSYSNDYYSNRALTEMKIGEQFVLLTPGGPLLFERLPIPEDGT